MPQRRTGRLRAAAHALPGEAGPIPPAAPADPGWALPIRRRAERRPVVLAAAALLYLVVFVAREADGVTSDAIGLLYVVPIALVALELGLAAGLAAAGLALGLIGVWALTGHVELGAIGLATRGVAYVAVGGIAGRFSERMREAQRRQSELLESGHALAHLSAADELADTLVRHAIELVDAHGARVELGGRRAVEHGDMSEPCYDVPIEVRGVRHGTLCVALSRPLRPEDKASLVALALQAALAEDNQRLLESERERAVIRAELLEANRRLEERRAQMHGLVAGQEAERAQVSYELHEQAAQTLAAVLLGLGALERQLGPELAPEQVATLREHVDGTLRALRSLAESLRPPALELGLKAAIQRLAGESRGRRSVPIDVVLPSPTGLDAELETTIYRVVEEALNAAGGQARLLMVRMDPGRNRLTIRVDVPGQPLAAERLAGLAGRLELVGGTLSTPHSGVRAVIPLRADHDRGRFTRAGSH